MNLVGFQRKVYFNIPFKRSTVLVSIWTETLAFDTPSCLTRVAQRSVNPK